MQNEVAIPSVPLAHRIPDACRRIGIGRTTIYELISAGELRVIKLGNRTLIPESELQRFIETRLAAAA
jgi:excisionase family DNA binding protein